MFIKLRIRLFKGLQLFDEEEGLKFIVTSCLGETLLHFIQALVNLLCPLPVGSVLGKQFSPINGNWTPILFHYNLLSPHCNISSEVQTKTKSEVQMATSTTASCTTTCTTILSTAWYVFLFACFLEDLSFLIVGPP